MHVKKQTQLLCSWGNATGNCSGLRQCQHCSPGGGRDFLWLPPCSVSRVHTVAQRKLCASSSDPHFSP
uniref:Uncharacterized protein n=1 Tax=Stegastes partitus TaxID=144197 RepID=A0A3B5AW54_9TELE